MGFGQRTMGFGQGTMESVLKADGFWAEARGILIERPWDLPGDHGACPRDHKIQAGDQVASGVFGVHDGGLAAGSQAPAYCTDSAVDKWLVSKDGIQRNIGNQGHSGNQSKCRPIEQSNERISYMARGPNALSDEQPTGLGTSRNANE